MKVVPGADATCKTVGADPHCAGMTATSPRAAGRSQGVLLGWRSQVRGWMVEQTCRKQASTRMKEKSGNGAIRKRVEPRKER